MNIYNKSEVKLFKINGKCIVVKYDEKISGIYELYFEGEASHTCPKLYVCNVNGKYMFGQYVEYRNAFTDLSHLNIQQKIFNFMLERVSNINKI